MSVRARGGHQPLTRIFSSTEMLIDLRVQLIWLRDQVLRENTINRLFDQNSGYWQNGLQGLDALTDAERSADVSG